MKSRYLKLDKPTVSIPYFIEPVCMDESIEYLIEKLMLGLTGNYPCSVDTKKNREFEHFQACECAESSRKTGWHGIMSNGLMTLDSASSQSLRDICFQDFCPFMADT